MNTIISTKNPTKTFRNDMIKTFGLFFLLVLVTGVGLWGMTVLINKEIKSLAILRGDEQWLHQGVENIAKLSAEKTEAEFLLASLQKIFPSALEVPLKTVSSIQTLMQEHRIIHGGVTVGEVILGSDTIPGVVAIAIGGEGSPEQVVRFIKNLEAMDTVIALQTFSIVLSENKKTVVMKLNGTVSIRP